MAFIDAQRKLGHKVYIHCKVGGWQMCVRAKIGLEKLVLHYWCTKKLFNDKKDDACSPTKKSTEGTLAELCLCFVRQVTAEPVSGARFWGVTASHQAVVSSPWGSTFPFWDGIFKHQLLITHAKRFEGVGCFPSFGVVRRSLFGNQKNPSISTAAFHRVPQCQ